MSAQRVKSCPWFPGAGSHASPEPRAQPGTPQVPTPTGADGSEPPPRNASSPPESPGPGRSCRPRPPEPRALADLLHDSEVTPGAAATSGCGRQDGDAYGNLRGREGGGARAAGSGRLPRISGPCGPFPAPRVRADWGGLGRKEEGGEERIAAWDTRPKVAPVQGMVSGERRAELPGPGGRDRSGRGGSGNVHGRPQTRCERYGSPLRVGCLE